LAKENAVPRDPRRVAFPILAASHHRKNTPRPWISDRPLTGPSSRCTSPAAP
jgi:hypothetical protein